MDINYFKAALSHHSKGNWNKAQEIYQHLLKEDPNNYLVLQNYGPLLAQLREYKLAKVVFQKCLKLKPKDSLMLYNYGKFFHDQKIYEKAIEYYNKSFEINPKNAMSKYNIGNIYFVQKKYLTEYVSGHGAFIVIPKPTIHMDRTDFGQCSMRFKDFYDFLDPLLAEWWNIFTEIDGQIGFTVSLVCRECRSGNVSQNLFLDRIQPFPIFMSARFILKVMPEHFFRSWVITKIKSSIFTHDSIDRPKTGNVVAPSCRASGHRDHAKAGFFQPVKHGKSFGGKSTLNR